MRTNNSMQSMMQQMINSQMPKMDINSFKQILPKINNQEMEQLKNMAKSMGMTDEQINQGINILNSIK